MSNATIQPGTPQIPSGNTLIQPGGMPVPSESLVTAGPGNADTGITAKASTGFTLTDSVGGNTFNITIIHD
jgi:hypothetical protein